MPATGHLNVRIHDEYKKKLFALMERMRVKLCMPFVSQADVLTAALGELEKVYPPGCAGPEAEARAEEAVKGVEGRKRGRPRRDA